MENFCWNNWNNMDIIKLGKFLKEKGHKDYCLKQIKKRCLRFDK